MRIIIVGAGEVGFHLAKLLSYESQDIYLIDQNKDKLDYINDHLDVITILGDSTSPGLLIQNRIEDTDLLIAVTESQNSNFTIAAIGKKLGAKKTIARVNNTEFLTNEVIDFKTMGIDFMVSPEALAANEIKSLLYQPVFDDYIEFEAGALNILGGKLTKNSPLRNLSVMEARKKHDDVNFTIVALSRENSSKTIVPRGNTIFHSGDHVYFAVPKKSIEKIIKFIGKSNTRIKDVLILGGSTIGKNCARTLCKEGFNVKLIEMDKKRAFEIAEEIPMALVINADGRNVDILKEENISEMDAFVAVTGNSETNIMSCLVAKSKGVKKTIALVENIDYIRISQTIGIDTLINKKLLAASSIFKHIRKGKIVSLANTHSLDAEVLEFEVREGSYLTTKTIKHLNLSQYAVICGVIRNDNVIMPYGDFGMKGGDKVIVFALYEVIHEVEDLFIR